MGALWTYKTAARASGGKAQGAWEIERVVIDSRRIRPGDLFVALKGERFDGHDFAREALAAGAAAIMVSRIPPRCEDAPLLLVGDTLKALEEMGRAARARAKAKIVGVTGSVGKTSAKEMLRLALSAHGTTHASVGNLNNHIGAPLTLANLPPDADFAVFELGMNHAGEISALTDMVRPHIAAITAIEAVHMEFFASLEAIADAKAEIFESMRGGIAVLNRDNALCDHLRRRARERGVETIVTFGAHAEADCRLLDYHPSAQGCAVEASIHGKKMSYRLAAIGKHWAATSLMVLAVTRALGLDDESAARALAEFSEPDGRGRVVPIGEALLVDDSYNASPAAMRAAFAKTAEVWSAAGGKGRKLAALGDMLELGPEGPKLHAGLADALVAGGFDAVFTAGALMKHLHDALPARLRAGQAATAMELLPLLEQALTPGDVLLVKGSHGSRMHEVAKKILQDAQASVQDLKKKRAEN